MIFVSVQGPHMPYSPFFFRVRVYTASSRSEIAGGPNSPKGGDAEPQVRWPPSRGRHGPLMLKSKASPASEVTPGKTSNARAALSHVGTVAGRGLNFTSTYSEAAASESESPTVHRVSAPPTGTLAEAGTKHRRIMVVCIPRPEAKFSGQYALLMEPEVLCPSKVFVVPGFIQSWLAVRYSKRRAVWLVSEARVSSSRLACASGLPFPAHSVKNLAEKLHVYK
ncbi:hypothetical protein LZ32DRAFT_656570 [Colletotrichum eremochloae]|nr:hypothetical protein LZ32DRAFT_656570 [Colletotrichum eremochloae]